MDGYEQTAKVETEVKDKEEKTEEKQKTKKNIIEYKEITDNIEEFEKYVNTLSRDQINKLAFEVDKHAFQKQYEMIIKRMRRLEGES